MPPRDVKLLIGTAGLNDKFRKLLLDPETRMGAITIFQNGENPKDESGKNLFGIGAEPEKHNLSPKEVKSLLEIEADSLEKFGRICMDRGLLDKEKGGVPPESSG